MHFIHDSKLKKMIDNIESISSNIKNNNESLSLALSNIALIRLPCKIKSDQHINHANSTLSKTSAIMEKINKGEGSMGMLINNGQLIHSPGTSAADLDKLLIDIKQNPKRYVHFSMFGTKPPNNL
jgi:phospholipid/cholesterol/gamma-HCH transport system substrate-binding protein